MVDAVEKVPPVVGPVAAQAAVGRFGGVRLWLGLVAVLVFLMILLGGYTRLSQSGLSMVDWRPVTGWLPPMTATEWQAAFEDYQRYPEFQKVNQDMDLAGFKRIYLVEYGHRLLGRLIGLAFFLPFAGFWLAGRIDRPLGRRLFLLLLLGAAQGVMGWYMVKSGLVDDPDVSAYRLAAHLALATAIFAGLVWTVLDLSCGRRRFLQSQGGGGGLVLGLVALQILLGAFVAGTDAGLVYNTFPAMGTGLLPADLWVLEPAWRNLFENPVTVQFAHRLVAYAIIAAVLWLLWHGRRGGGWTWVVAAAVAVQVALGITALLTYVELVPALAHQAGAFLLLTAVLCHRHRSLPVPA